mmetsp:Transcript_11211/g.24096  ORF Transcript_11211/g.24096 Transcript_11211/m.24096 type:complete len:410 (+) Transcript_11211:106-1335(+)
MCKMATGFAVLALAALCLADGIEGVTPNDVHQSIDVATDWHSDWGDTRHLLRAYDMDCDNRTELRGNGKVEIGNGLMTMHGSPRVYVYAAMGTLWRNVEVTSYIRANHEGDILDMPTTNAVISARTNHYLHKDDPCQAHAYYAKINFNKGVFGFQKEFLHDETRTVYSSTRSSKSFGPIINKFIGVKFVVRDDMNDVVLELYVDRTEGANGGTWEKVFETRDASDWPASQGVTNQGFKCRYNYKPKKGVKDLNAPVLRGGINVFLRSDAVAGLQWKTTSIREINPIRSDVVRNKQTRLKKPKKEKKERYKSSTSKATDNQLLDTHLSTDTDSLLTNLQSSIHKYVVGATAFLCGLIVLIGACLGMCMYRACPNKQVVQKGIVPSICVDPVQSGDQKPTFEPMNSSRRLI